jgi:hypothetical protein
MFGHSTGNGLGIIRVIGRLLRENSLKKEDADKYVRMIVLLEDELSDWK